MLKNFRQPAVAGQFYPADTHELREKVKSFLDNARQQKIAGKIKAIIVPHAGYEFSGPVAAYAYKQLEGRKINTVVLICNSHTAYIEGIAIDNHAAWKTPLGTVQVDKDLADKLAKEEEDINFNSEAHLGDHCLEVQLPFLQVSLKSEFKIVPIAFGGIKGKDYKKLAAALVKNAGEHDLIVISSDMSHYPNYEDANRIDKETLELIGNLDIIKFEGHVREVEGENVPNEQTLACGADGIKTVINMSRQLGWQAKILKYANSGDSPYGDKKSVVGYGAAAFIEESDKSDALSAQQQKELINIARTAVEDYVLQGRIPEFNISDPRLLRKEGAFVTLTESGNLRGCIGQIISQGKPLWQVVRDMAIAAATEDNRFEPVSRPDLKSLQYEISILSEPEKISDWKKIELGRHGVIIRNGLRGGVFLPQVAQETGWGREKFLANLCAHKAGLPADSYKDKNTEIYIFTAEVFNA